AHPDQLRPPAAEPARSPPIRCGISDPQCGPPARPPMARPEDRTYHSDVVGESGAGVQRSTAIVVFTDLVGSTELRSRLGEDAAEELRRQHDAVVGGAVEAAQGHLVKNLGDGIMARFAGASDAVGAAAAIQQAISRLNRS